MSNEIRYTKEAEIFILKNPRNIELIKIIGIIYEEGWNIYYPLIYIEDNHLVVIA